MKESYKIFSHTYDTNYHRIYVTICVEKGKFVDVMCITNDEFNRTYEYIMETGFGFSVYDMQDNTYDIPLNEALLFKMAREYVNTLIPVCTRS